jgi:hypothetical protein
VLDRSSTDEAHLIAFFLGEEGDLPPVVAGRLHADQHIGELVLPSGLGKYRMKIVEALPRIVDRGVAPEYVPFLIHEAGRVELAADIHPHDQGMSCDPLSFFQLFAIVFAMHGGCSSC